VPWRSVLQPIEQKWVKQKRRKRRLRKYRSHHPAIGASGYSIAHVGVQLDGSSRGRIIAGFDESVLHHALRGSNLGYLMARDSQLGESIQ
jgi:hypothetical protein